MWQSHSGLKNWKIQHNFLKMETNTFAVRLEWIKDTISIQKKKLFQF